jgi:four helix bundle protein
MFLNLKHTEFEIYSVTRKLVMECYKVTKSFPPEEKFALTQQIRRAIISVHLNLAEAASRKSIAERKRFYEISRSSLVESDAAFDIAIDLNYCNKLQLDDLGNLFQNCFFQLSSLINSQN